MFVRYNGLWGGDPMGYRHLAGLARVGFVWWLGLGLWLLPALVLAAPTPGPSPSLQQQMKTLYLSAMSGIKKQQWKPAEGDLKKLLPLFQRAQKKFPAGQQQYHLMTIGRADVLFHLAHVTWQQGRKRRSCLYHKAIADAIGTLPPSWRSWSIRPELTRRFQTSARHLGAQCQAVPSVVLLSIKPAQPKGLQVSLRDQGGAWKPLPSRRVEVTAMAISLRLEAPGYLPHLIEQRFVPRWQVTTIAIKLVPRPKARIVVIRQRPRAIVPRRPKPLQIKAAPFYKTWWFWTITGVVVAGTTTSIVLYATLPRTYQFGSTDGQTGFRISQ